jgi:hypothetical protein
VSEDALLERNAEERFFATRPDSEITNGVIPEEKHRDAPLPSCIRAGRMTGVKANQSAISQRGRMGDVSCAVPSHDRNTSLQRYHMMQIDTALSISGTATKDWG